jgi:DnaK suppressor protein
MLEPKQKVHRARLQKERVTAIDELHRLRETLQDEIDLEPDEGDAQITEHETAAILIAMLEQKVQEIDAALRSLKFGEYGICERCGQPIEPARLAAKPHACYCLICQEVVERALHEARVKQEFDVEAFSPVAGF